MIDLTGKKIGRLKVIKKTDMRQNRNIVWECVCECGTKTLVTTPNLNSGRIKSCGCLKLDKWNEKNSRIGFYDGTRICSLAAKTRKDNTSGYKGISWNKNAQKWQVEIKIRGEKIYLGRYDNKENAIKARKEAEEKYFEPVIEEFESIQINNKN